MQDSVVSTDRCEDCVIGKCPTAYLAFIAILVGVILIGGSFVALRLKATYQMEADILQMRIDHADLMRGYTGKFEEVSHRLDTLEKVLFGDIVAKVYAVKPPRPVFGKVEQWMLNRDQETRDRLDRLERWRLEVEKRW